MGRYFSATYWRRRCSSNFRHPGPCQGSRLLACARDFVFMVKKISQMHITGPKVIKEVTGESVTAEELAEPRFIAKRAVSFIYNRY